MLKRGTLANESHFASSGAQKAPSSKRRAGHALHRMAHRDRSCRRERRDLEGLVIAPSAVPPRTRRVGSLPPHYEAEARSAVATREVGGCNQFGPVRGVAAGDVGFRAFTRSFLPFSFF